MYRRETGPIRTLSGSRDGPCVALGIDMGGTHSRVGLVDRQGRVLAAVKARTLAAEGPGAALDRLAEAARGLLAAREAEGRIHPGDVAGIGIGTPGPVDVHRGVILSSPNLPGWRDVPVAARLSEALGMPVRHERDANVALLAEAWLGAARGHRDVVLLTLGTGIGGSVLVGGALHHGRDGFAWECGHMTIDPDGPPCGCGNRGCLEAFASGTGLQRRTGREGPELFAAAAAGEAAALAAVREAGAYLGIGLASLANIFNPSLIVLGGGLAAQLPLFYEPMVAEMRRRAFAAVTEGLEVVPAALGDQSGILGAARLVLAPGA